MISESKFCFSHVIVASCDPSCDLHRKDPVQTMLTQEMGVLRRLNSPVVSTFVNTDSIVFQRSEFKLGVG